LISNAGQFELIPLNTHHKALWREVIDLVVTEEQAARQRDIMMRFYRALLDHLPHDASDLDAGVKDERARGGPHAVFGLLRRAAIETWAEERRTLEPLDDAERERLDGMVARRAAELMREMAPPCRLDRKSFRSILETHIGCLWDRILQAVAEGDHDDAVVRTLARAKIGRGLKMPTECILAVLPGVERLDIFFALIGRTTDDTVTVLENWLQHDAHGADPAGAELVVRVLYAIWRLEQDPDVVRSIIKTSLERVSCEPASEPARMIKVWLTLASHTRGSYVIDAQDASLMERVNEAITVWEDALAVSLDEIVMSLPERAS
jgi:hypothetical protein